MTVPDGTTLIVVDPLSALLDMAASRRRERLPPMPAVSGRGRCRWCAEKIVYGEGHKRAGQIITRRTWHEPCVRIYKIAAWGEATRRAVYQRDKGVCAECKKASGRRQVGWNRKPAQWIPFEQFAWLMPSSELDPSSYCSRVWPNWENLAWEADHIVPLWSLPEMIPFDQRERWWGLENLQTLCEAHHKAKSAREAALRAALRAPQGTLLQELVSSE